MGRFLHLLTGGVDCGPFAFPQPAARMSTNAELPPVKIQITGHSPATSKDAAKPPTTEKSDGEKHDAR